jgi:hypothetical protein
VYCVPGARNSWDACPIAFQHPDERDPIYDADGVVIVVRNEPLPDGTVRVIGRSRDGQEHVVCESKEPYAAGALLEL